MLRKKTLSDFLSFSRRDRIAIFSMVMIIIALYLTPHFIDQGQEDILRPDNFLLAAIDTLQHKQQVAGSEQQDDFSPFSPPKEQWPARIFEFDPNTLTVKGWQKLGLNEKTSQTIERYRQKGGRFYKPADLQKIWGLPKGFYERVKDHISISAPEETSGKNIYEKTDLPETRRTIHKVHINEADTSAFIALPGIGSKLASRIISFREKLGGFYAVEQIRETYGLADSTYQKIRTFLIEGGEVKKININLVTKEELKKHPYFKWNLVNAIIEYRNQHGPFKNMDDLKNIVLMDELTFQRIRNYLIL